jgi:hypothetical protein
LLNATRGNGEAVGSPSHLDNDAARRLLYWNVAVFCSLVLHDVDHLRQARAADFDIPLDLFLANAADLYAEWARLQDVPAERPGADLGTVSRNGGPDRAAVPARS